MMKWFKPVLYLVLIGLAIWTLTGFVSNMRASKAPTESRLTDNDPSDLGEAKRDQGAQGRMIAFLFGFLGTGAALGFMISRDANRWFADHAEEMLFNDDVQKANNPDYENAERIWANGQFLDAISALRDFLKRNPREIYAAIRIAEIYESDLQNHLAAALEYEEVLKHKFSAERWAWAAIHLVNIYSGKLDKHDEAVAWLKRIAKDVPKTSAAKKARERLRAMGIDAPEPVVEPAAKSEVAEAEPEPELETESSEPEPPAKPQNTLPKGFRPKS